MWIVLVLRSDVGPKKHPWNFLLYSHTLLASSLICWVQEWLRSSSVPRVVVEIQQSAAWVSRTQVVFGTGSCSALVATKASKRAAPSAVLVASGGFRSATYVFQPELWGPPAPLVIFHLLYLSYDKFYVWKYIILIPHQLRDKIY